MNCEFQFREKPVTLITDQTRRDQGEMILEMQGNFFALVGSIFSKRVTVMLWPWWELEFDRKILIYYQV